MSASVATRQAGLAGRITLTRPQKLNALNHDMVRAIDAALVAWAADPAIRIVVIDADGPRAFCAGGDIAEIYHLARAGRFDDCRRFWRDEYRMNARIGAYPKPVVSLMQGYTMGSGVGLGAHAAHRVIGETSRVAMPETAIGMVPDVGGSALLARAPGRLGDYLGLSGVQMDPGGAILAGFADHHVPQAAWPDLIAALEATGDTGAIAGMATPPPPGALVPHLAAIDRLFAPGTLPEILGRLRASTDAFARDTLAVLGQNAPLAMACTAEILRRLRPAPTLRDALGLEYRYAARVFSHGDLSEGARARVIDKDQSPRWHHPDPMTLPQAEVAAMLAPLNGEELVFDDAPPLG